MFRLLTFRLTIDFPLISELQFYPPPVSQQAPPQHLPPKLSNLQSSYVNLPRRNSDLLTQPSKPSKPPRLESVSSPPPKQEYKPIARSASQPAIPLKPRKQSIPSNSLDTLVVTNVSKFTRNSYINLDRSPTFQVQPDDIELVKPHSSDRDTVNTDRRRSYESLRSVVPAPPDPLTETYVDPISVLRHSAIPRSWSMGDVSPGL